MRRERSTVIRGVPLLRQQRVSRRSSPVTGMLNQFARQEGFHTIPSPAWIVQRDGCSVNSR